MTDVSASFENEAFGISSINTRTFAHELGHIMGLHHDRYVRCDPDRCRDTSYVYAHGYVNQRAFDTGAPGSARWITIMSYGNQCADAGFSCSLLLRFSNPSQIHPDPGGDPLGVAGDEATTAVTGPGCHRP